MRRLPFILSLATVLAVPAAALAANGSSADGSLVVKGGQAPKGTPVVQLTITGSLSRAVLKHVDTGEEKVVEVDGAFIAIGHQPQSELVAGQVETDEDGYVITEGKSTRTSVPGVFAAGDLVDHTYRQAVTAAGTGCQAALDAEWYLRDTPMEAIAEEHWAKVRSA